MTMLSDEQKKRVEEMVKALLADTNASFPDSDTTETLAALYGAAQLIERELLNRGRMDIEQLAYVQLVGKRVGAAMPATVEEEVLDDPGNHNIH
jgi:hypothetical protein